MKRKWCFALEEAEIKTQLRWFARPFTGSRNTSGKPLEGGEGAINFPTTIGDGLDQFSILRRIFVRTSENQNPDTDKQANDVWTVLQLPVTYGAESTLVDGTYDTSKDGDPFLKESPIPESQSFLLDGRYNFKISLHGEYVLYMVLENGGLSEKNDETEHINTMVGTDSEGAHDDNKLTDTGVDGSNKQDPGLEGSEGDGEEDACDEDVEDSISEGDDGDININDCLAISMVVFELNCVQNGGSVRLVNDFKNSCDDEYIGKHAFHPSLPLMAFHLDEGENKGGSIILWDLSSHPNPEDRWIETVHKLDHLHWTEGLQFSASGKEIIIELYSAERPTVMSIESTMLYQMLNAEQDGNLAGDWVASSPAGGSVMKPASGPPPPPILSHMQLILHDDRSSTRLNFRPNPSQTDIDLVRSDDRGQILQPLLALPVFPDIRHLDVTVAPPRDADETKMRIVLTKSAKLYCTLADGETDMPSAIIEKDTRALLQGMQRRHGQSQAWKAIAPMPHLNSYLLLPASGE